MELRGGVSGAEEVGDERGGVIGGCEGVKLEGAGEVRGGVKGERGEGS